MAAAKQIRPATAEALNGHGASERDARDSMPSFDLRADQLHAALAALRDRAGFSSVTLVTAIDRWGQDNQRGKARFEVVHQLYSHEHSDRVRLVTAVEEAHPTVPTCTDLWPGANFMERECADLMGIQFSDHPDPRRLMMPDGFEHHPLRKDFPQQGIEPDRLFREWDRQRHLRFAGEEAGA